MNLLAEGNYEIKKSKFISHLYKLADEDTIKTQIAILRKEHKKAAHVCYAAIIKGNYHIKNDREVGNPGQLLFNFLQNASLETHLLVCIRYYGGTKLGVGGVVKAFKASAKDCLSNFKAS